MAAMALAPTQVERPACWCCGSMFAEQDLTRLGIHPEVGVCAGCAQWLHRARVPPWTRAGVPRPLSCGAGSTRHAVG
jgi:hypothetical protein